MFFLPKAKIREVVVFAFYLSDFYKFRYIIKPLLILPDIANVFRFVERRTIEHSVINAVS